MAESRPDTGAREPLQIAFADAGYVLRWLQQTDAPANIIALQERATTALAAAALAAGVGVPPPENQDLVSALGQTPPESRGDTKPSFRRWLVMGEEGSVQRERYDRAVAAWNAGATEDEVAAIMGLPPRGPSAAVGRKPNTDESESAGVGEARPAEPELLRSRRNDDGTIDLWFSDGTQLHAKRSVGAPAEEQPDAREQS